MKQHFGLYLILTNPVVGYEACAEAAVAENVHFLQLRMKNTPPNIVIETGKRIQKITHGTNTHFIINDNLEIAMACNADGIHLGQSDMTIEQARKRWNTPGKLFGLSTHSLDQAQKAASQQPDYIGIGPVFPTPTKKDADPALGISETGRISQKTSLTSVAIGGINESNLKQVLQAGASNYCVVRAVNQAPNPREAIQQLQQIWKNHTF